MNASLSPVSMDTGLLLLGIMGYVTMATACPSLCQCNLDYFVYCRGIRLSDVQLRTVMTEMPNRVRLLDLGFNQISVLPPGIFSNLPNLRTLNLVSNKINNLPNEAFLNLPNLDEIFLNNNVLHQVTSSPWRNIPHLKKIDVSDNYIDYLDSGAFTSLTNLTSLSLRSNQIGAIETGTFSGLTSLRSLDVSNNVIHRVANNSFSSLEHLRTLDLSYNMLTEVHAAMFVGLTRLSSLVLDFNKISDLTQISTSDFYPSLVKLYVSNNDLTSVPGNVFVNFRKLQELLLNKNKISLIPRGAFLGLDMEKLSLSDNKLTRLQRDMFQQVRRIRYLDFSHNKITSLSTGVFDSFRETILTLQLQDNELLYIDPGHFRGMVHLQCLNLSKNSINIVKDGSFSDLRDLQDLVLSDNDLETVTTGMLEGVSLQSLYLICNPLQHLVGFRYDEQNTNPKYIHMNLTVVSESDTSVKVKWPYSSGSQIYWTLKIVCLNEEVCSAPLKDQYLAPFKTAHVVQGLSAISDYYVCVNPVFVNTDVHIEQCIHVRTRRNAITTSASVVATQQMSSGSQMAPSKAAWVIFTSFLISLAVL
ncbi:leucine-rich repeat-containing protein 15-like [Haliotis rubra]|uniref:leucine-rich repeat-containing protein 15-like n=1 Tax=Haliotis rubra TaxID=36100 RepID=UPI001EE5D295|nr:leucine-rich repeat-containing protein 15-like [Haliotis rubra]XP_046553509.1 leucine-rich repeat-containing protein 15-like [Haliotis rubra]XP_046553510.1 leucine-rich repeat-containing protein 15-like [Haliotis rubra]XP_046553512.1 leucine-rich repeat-containing protein 15-like [Haliotis rubra]XP_046553513.1 leucine-rich repeat-containing protein 15-like [Haliotis rubra]